MHWAVVLAAVAAIGLGGASQAAPADAERAKGNQRQQHSEAVAPGGGAENGASGGSPRNKGADELNPYERESLAIDRAAIRAAERANVIAEAQRRYSFVQLVLGFVGVVLTGVAAYFAYRATHWAREAAVQTKRSADADNEALSETRAAAVDARQAAALQAKRLAEQSQLADQTMQFTAKTAYAMSDTARETRRGATAMAGVATAMAVSAEKAGESVIVSRKVAASQQLFGQTQLRAYVSVLLGPALYQVRGANLRFETSPTLTNTGHTPARNIRWRIQSAILPNPLPDDFRFPIPKHQAGSSLLPPQQSFEMKSVVAEFIDEDAVEATRYGLGRSLYVWGYVVYEDIFQRTHRTTFAQQVFWQPSGPVDQNWDTPERVRVIYLSKHNRAN